MATEAVNGHNYDQQYSQPAELAASTPANGSTSHSNTGAAPGQKPDPQEIGWYFVEQYYTTLSKSPDKIHLFYNKKSQLITGSEAEKVLPAVGSKAISDKIKSLDISDCKIRVLNVDCQASFDNIVVQVIGEMSNKNQPHHKFVQTFILATQPNGYFVLNDIFRYLNEDEDEVVDDTTATVEETATSSVQEAAEDPQPITTPAMADEIVNTEAAASKVDEELEDVAKDSSSTAEQVNGDEPEVETAAEEPEEVKPEAETETPVPTPEVAEKEETSEPVAQPAAAPVPDGPPVKKTWASLVSNSKTAQAPALPQTQSSAPAPSQPKPQATRSVQQSTTPKPSETSSETADTPTSQSNGWQEAGKKTKQQNKAPEGIVHAYIKNVNDKTDARVLREVLEKFGKLKYFDVSRPKQCAFVEFEDPAAYAAAVAENPHTVGTESINVEERRPRPGAAGGFNNYTPRGGANAGRGRGGTQPRTGSQGGTFRDAAAGRGNVQNRGAKSGTPTRGRGQSTA